MRVLLVEDQPDAARMLAKGLREQAYAVDVANTAATAGFRAATTDYDAIILDVMLPDGNGVDLCRQLRAAESGVPILMLTARDSVPARIAGLDSGADDYLTKPFDFQELLARLRAIIRRGVRPPLPERLTCGPLTLDTRTRTVMRDGRPIPLTSREYSLLEYFVRHPAQIVGRAELAEHVWDESYDPFTNVIDVYVQRLRRKIDVRGDASLIRTSRGHGYALVAPGKP